ncbi:MAG: bifunctional metallophosphatase/5'-nucleotidase [Eggerthellaceae bacterium]|nr:bifunctional metallophosphatase/5'-nucleotidase [Eggerthellaceae bacterium]
MAISDSTSTSVSTEALTTSPTSSSTEASITTSTSKPTSATDTTRHLTILHTNDLHNDLYFKIDQNLVMHGGISLLSGYVQQARKEAKNIFFSISGDVLQTDLWGSDYKGVNTVNLINTLAPDAISLGNHELDYGLAHTMVFKACVDAPLLNSNIEVARVRKPLFDPSMVYHAGSVSILLIGLIPRGFFDKISSDEFNRAKLIYIHPYDAIRAACKAHAAENPDLVVLMTHMGIEGDPELAASMPSDLHVDFILGGHSHTEMDEPEVVNGIPIVQVGYGTKNIGRLEVDLPASGPLSYTWQRIELTDEMCTPDYRMDELADAALSERKVVPNDELTQFAQAYVHDSRLFETQLGDLVSDAFLETYDVDFIILQSGSLRRESCGPVFTRKDLRELYPFNDAFLQLSLTGAEIRSLFDYLFSLKEDKSIMGGTFQYSKGFRLEVDATDCWNRGCTIEAIELNGQSLEDNRIYNIGITRNCLESFGRYFGTFIAEDNPRVRVLSYSTYHDLERWMIAQSAPIEVHEPGRFILKNFAWPTSN